jgi:hypothetical protein
LLVVGRGVKKTKRRGLYSVKTYDDKNVIVSFIFNDIKYVHPRKKQPTYINYREKFLA